LLGRKWIKKAKVAVKEKDQEEEGGDAK